MLAIIEQWQEGCSYQTDNTDKYMFLVLFKLALDMAVFSLCHRKLCMSFLSMCSVSIILADLVLACLLAAVWHLGSERSPMSLCVLLANASATYGVLPLPMMILGFLDYCLEDNCLCSQSTLCKYLRNTVLILLGWVLAVIYSLGYVKAELVEVDYEMWMKVLLCKVEESTLITYYVLVLFTAVICAMLPFWSNIPRWLKEVDRISEARDEQDNLRSDFRFTSADCMKTQISNENCLEVTIRPRPPLWLSLTLGFALFWMPYLAISVACLVFDFGVPAYITINVLWLECTNSLLMGIVFWAKSDRLGPYSHLPENVCLWHAFWHLSKGTGQHQVPIAVFNPSKEKRATLLYV